MEHRYWDLGSCATGTRLEVSLRGSAARVCLMDIDEYQAYRDEYHGGFCDVSPVILEVPYDDTWFLVVDSNHHRIRVKFTEIFDNPLDPSRHAGQRPLAGPPTVRCT